ncbi:MAG: hypothetical protein ACRD1U_01615 [Vicinamibacterales bacterium]
MQIKSGFRQALISAVVFCAVVAGLASVDPRVKEQMQNFVFGGNGLSSWDNRASDLGHALVSALRYQSIENSPMTFFVVAGVVLFVFMVKA